MKKSMMTKKERTLTLKNYSRNAIVKMRPIIWRKHNWGYEVKLIDFASPWSRSGGPEVTTQFFINEKKAEERAKFLAGATS